MGTRNLTAVMSDGQYKIAQYGQWNGYPDGQGLTALRFCREHLTTAEGREAFKRQLGRVRFVGQEEHERMWEQVGVARGVDFVSMEKSAAFHKRWPHFSRDHGAKILDLVAKAPGEVLTTNEIAFARDSLFCEWAWVIDLDRLTFEAYEGFNKKPVPAGERFADLPKHDEAKEYFPIRLARQWRLDDLPSEEAFLAALKDADEAAE